MGEIDFWIDKTVAALDELRFAYKKDGKRAAMQKFESFDTAKRQLQKKLYKDEDDED